MEKAVAFSLRMTSNFFATFVAVRQEPHLHKFKVKCDSRTLHAFKRAH